MIHRLILATYLLSSLIFASEEEPWAISSPDYLASLGSELVGGIISPFSGQPVMEQINKRL